jgi:hypothetical protein
MALLTLVHIQRRAGGLDAAQVSLDRCRTLIDAAKRGGRDLVL